MKDELRTAKVSAARVHEEYENKAEISPASEPMTFAYVDAALTTFDRGLCLSVVNGCVLKCEAVATVHPFDSVYKLLGIIQKGSRPYKIEWLCVGLCDLFISGAMAGDEFSISQITGGKKKHHCLADVLLLKLEMQIGEKKRLETKFSALKQKNYNLEKEMDDLKQHGTG